MAGRISIIYIYKFQISMDANEIKMASMNGKISHFNILINYIYKADYISTQVWNLIDFINFFHYFKNS